MVQIALTDLEMALKLVRSSSNDTMLQIVEDGYSVQIKFVDASGQLVTIELSEKLLAKVTSTEQLSHVVGRLKRP